MDNLNNDDFARDTNVVSNDNSEAITNSEAAENFNEHTIEVDINAFESMLDDVAKNNGDENTVSITVESELTDDELLELADKIVEKDSTIQSLEIDLVRMKADVSELKKEIADYERDRRSMILDYDHKRKSTTYTCTKNVNYDTGQIEFVDVFTSRIVQTEPFDENDLFANANDAEENNETEDQEILETPEEDNNDEHPFTNQNDKKVISLLDDQLDNAFNNVSDVILN